MYEGSIGRIGIEMPSMRRRTNSQTLARISIARMSSSGSSSASAIVRPPKPQPMSRTVIGFVSEVLLSLKNKDVYNHIM